MNDAVRPTWDVYVTTQPWSYGPNETPAHYPPCMLHRAYSRDDAVDYINRYDPGAKPDDSPDMWIRSRGLFAYIFLCEGSEAV